MLRLVIAAVVVLVELVSSDLLLPALPLEAVFVNVVRSLLPSVVVAGCASDVSDVDVFFVVIF